MTEEHTHTWIVLASEHGPRATYGCQHCEATMKGSDIRMSDPITEPEQWAEANSDGCPYNPSTPEARVWRKAQEDGKDAASWVFDGNTKRETYAAMLKGIDDEDPKVMDSVRTPSLSGEFADDYSEDDLMSDVGWVPHDGTDARDALAEQYNVEVSEAFWHEVERAARYQVDDDS